MTEYSKFGLDKETIEKSIDVLPTFDLGKLELGCHVYMTVLEREPKEVEVNDKFTNGKKTTRCINVFVEKVIRANGEEVAYGENMNLWLSSKSLAIGFFKAYEENNKSLKDVMVKITIGETEYKKFGTNRCYTVNQIKPN